MWDKYGDTFLDHPNKQSRTMKAKCWGAMLGQSGGRYGGSSGGPPCLTMSWFASLFLTGRIFMIEYNSVRRTHHSINHVSQMIITLGCGSKYTEGKSFHPMMHQTCCSFFFVFRTLKRKKMRKR